MYHFTVSFIPYRYKCLQSYFQGSCSYEIRRDRLLYVQYFYIGGKFMFLRDSLDFGLPI